MKLTFYLKVVTNHGNGDETKVIRLYDQTQEEQADAYWAAVTGYDPTCALSPGDRDLKFLSPCDIIAKEKQDAAAAKSK